MANWCSVANVVSLCVAFVLCVGGLSGSSAWASDTIRGVPAVEIDGKYARAVKLPDGRLMVSHVEGKSGSKEDIENTEIVQQAFAEYSADDGRTWSEPQFLFDFPKSVGRYGGNMILCDRDSNIHLFGSHYFHWDWGKFAGKNLVTHVMSSDGGQTWTPLQFCDFGYQYTGGFTMTMQLSSGRLLIPVGFAAEHVRRWGTVNVISDDGGQTWSTGREELLRNDVDLDEATCVELSDGRVLSLFRAGGGYQYECYITDNGDGWTEPQPSRFVSPSAPAQLLRLSDGRIVVVWSNCLKPKHVLNRLVLAAAISDDEGQTWHGYREVARVDSTNPPLVWVCYPNLKEGDDGSIALTYYTRHDFSRAMKARVDPDWLMETHFHEDFSAGLDDWITMKTEGATVAAHPKHPERQVLQLRKPNPDVAAGASLNFPFGVQGRLTTRVYLRPGFHGGRITLTDHFTYPYYAEDGAFSFNIAPDGTLGIGQGEGKYEATDVALDKSKWYEVSLQWDAEQSNCQLLVDGELAAQLPELSDVPGVCYLRLWLAAEGSDESGMLVESVDVSVKP